MNPWEKLKQTKKGLPPQNREALADLLSRPIIDFFTPIEELKPLMEFLAIEDGGGRGIN